MRVTSTSLIDIPDVLQPPCLLERSCFKNIIFVLTKNGIVAVSTDSSLAHDCYAYPRQARIYTIRLKKLKPRAPDFWSPKISGVRTISSIFGSNCACIFVLVQRTFFYYAANKRSV